MAKKQITNDDIARMVQEGFHDMREDMATKEDLKQVATKEDLKQFATKDDLLELKQELINQIARQGAKTSRDYFTLREWVKDIDERLMSLETKQAKKA